MSTVFQDLRYGVRILLKAPAFTAIAVLSLALGIGANTTIFTLVNAVLLNPLPLERPSELVSAWTTDEKNHDGFNAFLSSSRLNYVDLRDRNEVFSGLAAHQFLPVNISGGTGEPQQVIGEMVTGNYFTVLGAHPMFGRGFLPEEDRTPGARLVTVLGYNLWQTRFGGDRAILGRTITLDNQAFTVVGVMPKEFRGTNPVFGPALWVPVMSYPQTTSGFMRESIDNRRALVFNVTGRVKPGVTIEQASANLKTIARQLETSFPNENGGRSVTLVPLSQATINPGMRGTLVVAGGLLMTIVALVLLIACANVANLLLARASARQREIAIRLALGASRARLVRQLLTEGVLLAMAGGVIGLLLAKWAQAVLWSLRPAVLQATDMDLGPDGRVLLFTALVSLATGLLFGLVPALQASRPDLVSELKEKTGGAAGANRLFSPRNVLVVAQLALSLVALVGAGLFLRSLQHAQRITPGVDVDHVFTMTVDLGAQGYTEARGREFQRAIVERVSSVGGVQGVALANNVPLFLGGGGFSRTVLLEGQDVSDRRSGRLVQIDIVTPQFFQTVGIPLLRGRNFAESDQPNTPAVAIVNETMAKRFWPGEDPIGKRFRFFGQDYVTQVVGIAKDSKYNFIGEDPTPYLYQPLTQVYEPQVSLLVRTMQPHALVATVRRNVQQMDANLPLTNVFTLSEVLDQSLWAPRMAASLLAVFAALSLTLAIIGIYGVMAYTVTQRTRELGIRMALGASRGDVQRLVIAGALRLAAIGVAVGLLAAFAVSRFVAALLYDVSPTDVVTFAVVPALLAVAALVASYLPARRATHIDPMVALRYE